MDSVQILTYDVQSVIEQTMIEDKSSVTPIKLNQLHLRDRYHSWHLCTCTIYYCHYVEQ